MRRILITFVIVLAVAVGLGGVAVATSGGSDITKPRLERSLTATFDNIYTQQAKILGHKGVSPESMHSRTMCDKGPGVPQSGPSTNWNCLMSWHDPNVTMPDYGYGHFELTVHSNGCYTAGGPSNVVGYQTITDRHGNTVTNPAYEFDGCIDPNTDNTPTGVTFAPRLTIANTTASVDAQGHAGVDLNCYIGNGRCVGEITAKADGKSLGTAHFDMPEQGTVHLTLPDTVPAGAKQLTYLVPHTTGPAVDPTPMPIQR